jgi:hypothetical protein
VRPQSQLSRIDELSLLVHPRDGHPKLFAMVEAYLDESGIHGDATVCVVAGYFGLRNHWNHFETAWRKVLHRFNFQLADFHAKDQIKSGAHRPMLLELARTISKFQIFPVSMTIAVNDFKSLPAAERKWLTGGSFSDGKLVSSGAPSKPYFLPFQLALMRVTEYTKAGSKAHIFCGLDRSFSGYAQTLFAKIKTDPPRAYSEWTSKYRLGDILFPMASETPELQAADLFAHLTYIHMRERDSLRNTQAKPSEMLRLCVKNQRSQMDNGCMDKACILSTFDKAYRLKLKRESA